VRKALAAGANSAEVEQVVALAASTIGLPSTVAAWTWVREQLGRRPRRR
jgi:alkylhydroperoxidase/carboxymuconolactone decarboxylase family protein YurZ